jgi:hypothetical protein
MTEKFSATHLSQASISALFGMPKKAKAAVEPALDIRSVSSECGQRSPCRIDVEGGCRGLALIQI